MSIQSEINRLKNNVAATYAAMEEQGATMPTQQNSANMAATARTIPTGGGGGTTVQADLAVNDPSNARYVKNRTHWKEETGVDGVIIASTLVDFYNSNSTVITGDMSDGIKVGGKYLVTWAENSYSCIAKDSWDGAYVGNGTIMGLSDAEDTGEPFCVLLFGGTMYQVWTGETFESASIRLQVIGKKETVWHKLDSRFLNDALQFGTETKVILPETTGEFVAEMEGVPIFDVLSVEVGKTYTVKWNGTEYVCTAQLPPSASTMRGAVLGNLGLVTGGVSTGEPFMIMCFGADSAAEMGIGGLAAPLDGSETVTLSITYNGIKKIDGKYLPDGVPYVESGSADIIPETTIEIDPESGVGVYANKIKLTAGETYVVKWNGTEYNCVAQDSNVPVGDGSNIENVGVGVGDFGLLTGGESTGEPFFIVAANATGEALLGVSTAIQALDGSASVVLSIFGKGKVVHKIAGELLTEGTPYAEPFDDVIMAAWPSSIGSDGMFSDPVGKVVVGNVYKVNWGGTVYECVAREVNGNTYLGNGANDILSGGIATADPFCVVFIAPEQQILSGYVGCIIFDNAPENNDFSITGHLKVQKINKHCLPAMPEPLFVPITFEGNYWSCNVPFAEVEAALSGEVPKLVYLIDPKDTRSSDVYKFESQNGGTLWFSRIAVYSDSTGKRIVQLDLMEWKRDSTTINQTSRDLA